MPSVADIKRAVESGQRITAEDVSVIAQSESELTGTGPVRGGPAGEAAHLSNSADSVNPAVCFFFFAATAQSFAMRQMNFDTKIDEVSRKPQSHITQEDAREIQSTEVRPP